MAGAGRRARVSWIFGLITILAVANASIIGGAAASIPVQAHHKDCGVVSRADVPATRVVVEIGTSGCARARHVIGFALAHVHAAGVAVSFRGPRGWGCTRGVFPLQPGQGGSRYDTAHSMSCAAPAGTSYPRAMIAGFFLSR